MNHELKLIPQSEYDAMQKRIGDAEALIEEMEQVIDCLDLIWSDVTYDREGLQAKIAAFKSNKPSEGE